jgi:hypothetical protein
MDTGTSADAYTGTCTCTDTDTNTTRTRARICGHGGHRHGATFKRMATRAHKSTRNDSTRAQEHEERFDTLRFATQIFCRTLTYGTCQHHVIRGGKQLIKLLAEVGTARHCLFVCRLPASVVIQHFHVEGCGPPSNCLSPTKPHPPHHQRPSVHHNFNPRTT